jgi:hypothetical protein
MRTTLEVKSEVDIVGELLFDSGPFEVRQSGTTTRTNYCIKTQESNDYDNYYAREKVVFLHCRKVYCS